MSLIFDRFPTVAHAEAFVIEVRRRFGADGQVFMDAREAQAHDPFWGGQDPPIVHVDRHHCVDDRDLGRGVEVRIEMLVDEFGGTYLGT